MAADLDVERDRLLQRLAVLERQHKALHDGPYDHQAHEAHHSDLVAYRADVRAYRERLIAKGSSSA